MEFIPVDYDPFAQTPPPAAPIGEPVDYDPFSRGSSPEAAPSPTPPQKIPVLQGEPVDYDPFAQASQVKPLPVDQSPLGEPVDYDPFATAGLRNNAEQIAAAATNQGDAYQPDPPASVMDGFDPTKTKQGSVSPATSEFLQRELPETSAPKKQALPAIFQEALDRSAERWKDPMAATGEPVDPQALEQGESPPFWQRIKETTSAATRVSPERQALAVGLSEQTGASPSAILKNWDVSRRQAGMTVDPSTGELAGGLMMAPVVAGMMTNPLTTAAALAAFEAADEGVSGLVSYINGKPYHIGDRQTLVDLLSPESSDLAKGAVGAIDFAVKGAVAGAGAGAGLRVGREAFRKTTIDQTPSVQEYMSPEDFGKLHDAGMDIPAFLGKIGLKPNEFEAALRNGVDVFVPSGTRVTTSDRPWVESLKGLFGIKPTWEQTTTWNQQNLGGIPAEAPRPRQEPQQTASPEPNFSQAALPTEPPTEGQSSTIQKPSDQPPGSSFRLGSITGKYESDGDYGMVSTGDRWGDPGGVSYGKYQLATNTGTFDAFLKFAGESAPSDKAGRAAWWKERSKDPAFNAKQDAFIQATHYEPVRRYLLDNYGVDANQVPMLAETLYAAGNAHGPKRAEGILKRALEGQDVAAMAPADIVNAIYDERMMPGENGGLAYWKSSPAKVQWSVARRLAQERADVLALSGDGTVSSMEAQGETTVAPQRPGVVRPRETFDLLRGTAPAGQTTDTSQAEQTGPPAEQPATPVETPPPVNADEQALSTFLGQEPASQVAPSISPQPSPGETPSPPREPAPVPPAPAKIETPAVDVSQPTLGTPPAATVMTTASPTPPTSVTPNLAPRIEELSALPSRKLMAMAKEHGVALRGPTKIQDLAQMIAEAEAAQQTDVVETAAHAAATSPLNELPQPTEPQKQAGNYQKGHVRIQGLDISIENPAGSVRSGTTPDGRAWQTPMQNHYGYIKGTKGKDKDHLDVFLGPSPEVSPRVFVVNQTDPNTGKFDEHKVMVGFDSPEQAKAAYLSNYEPGWQGFGSMASMDMPGFKGWLKNGSQNRPAVDRKPLLQNKGMGGASGRPLDQPGMAPGQQGPGLQESISPATASAPDEGMPVSPVGQGEDSPASAPPMPGPDTDGGPSVETLAMLPVRQLRTMAQEHGVKLAGPVKKTDLAQMIVEAQAQKTPPKTREDSSPLSDVRFQRTYQGSPTRGIEQMDDAYLGTGEGGRKETGNDYSGAYGWGHYSAQNRKVGEKYRELLQAGSGNKMRDTMARIEAAAHGDLKGAAAIAHDRANMSHLTQEGRKYFNQIAKLFEEGQSATGQLYQLEVPDSDKLLDWDKTLDEQPEGIKEKLEQLLSGSRDKIMSMPNRPVDLSTAATLARGDKMTGGDLYESMAIHLGSAKAASQYLNSIGIPGHQYLDASSRGEGEGTHNIVTYSGRHIDITDRFRRGNPSVGGTAAPDIREALRPALERYPRIARSVDVYNTEPDLPYRLRRKVERAGVSGRFHGMYDPLSGRIAIVSGNIPNTKITQKGFVEALLQHEGRHKGLDRVFGSARMKQAWMSQAAKSLKEDVSAWLKDNNLEDTSENRAEAAEEILVDWAKRGKVHALVDKLLAKIAAWVRSIFPDLKLTKAELRQMLARSDDWLKGSNADGARFFGKKETAPAFARGEAGEASSYSVNDATMPRTAKTFAEARTAAKAFVGKELANNATGMVATVSNTTVSKMLSESAVRKSVSPEAQAYAVANLDKLFKNSEELKVHPDRDGNEAIKAIHRMYAPMLFQGDILITKMTVKELREQRDGNRIYSVETMEIEKAAGNWVASIPGRNQENSTPQAAFMEKIRALQAKVKEEADRASGQEESAPPRYQRSSSPGSGSEASSPAEGATGRRNRRETAPEDLKQSHAVKLEMPELVTLAKGLLGQYPKVYARLFGRRVGSFHHGIGHTSEIKLRASNYIGIELGSAVVKDQAEADAFVDSILKAHKLNPEDVTVTTKAAPGKRISVSVYDTDQDYAAEVLAHEIGHLIDYLPDQTLARGNVLGHIASLKKYMGDFLANGPQGDPPLTPQDKLRLKKEAARLAQGKAYETKIDEEIEKIVGGVTPDEILSIWRDATAKDKLPADLYNYVAGLSGVEKKSIMVQALKGLVPEQLKRFTKTIKVKTGRLITQTVSASVTEADIKAEYERLLHAEIAKRRLFSAADLTTELKALTRWWDPFDPAANPKYTAYRHKNTELYADALSVLLNAPNELATRAPNFHEAFFNWMMSKPKVTKLWRDLQTAVVTGDIQKDRVERIYDMFKKSDEAYREKYDKPLKTMTPIKTAFIDRFAPIYEILTGPGPRFALEKAVYSGSQKEGYLRDMLYRVQTPLEKVGLTADNLGEYLFHLRVVGERDKMANPLGMTAKASQERLDEIESGRVFNSKQVEALKHAEQEFRKIRSKDITDFMRKSGMFSPDLMKSITANKVYSTFDVFLHSVEENYGRGVGALIHQQIGTHQEITNPYTATLMHDLAMIGSINWNTAKRAVIQDVIRGKMPGLIEPADQRFNGKVMAPVEPKDPAKGMIAYMDKGEVKAFYVDKMVADAFKSGSAEEINALGKILFYAANPFRLLFTQLRPGFQLFNIIRDARTLSLNLPGANNELRVAKEYAKAIVPAFQSAFGLPNEVVREMERQNMLLAVASPADLSREDRQSERLYQMYGLKPKLWKAHVFGPLNDAATWIALCALKAQNTAFSLGAALERIPKVAGYTYLKQYFPNMSDDEIGHRIRAHAGSPAFLMRSAAHSVTNNIFLFSNAFVQGWRASLEVMRESPQSYWWKWTKWSLLPKAAMLAAAAGLLGAGIRELMDGVSEYDKTNYTIIPLGKDSNGKTVYLRLPMDETSRFTGGLLWKTFGAAVDVARDRPVRLDRASQVLDFTAGQFPGLHPAITTLEGVANYAMGHNPYDPFRQRPVLDDTTFTAGGKYAAKDMAGWAWNNLGGGVVYTFKSGEDIPKLKSEFETIVGLPGLGDTLGRFLKVSNTGIHEQLRDAKVPVNQANARLLLDVRAAAAKALNKEPLTEDDKKAIQLGTKKFGNALMKGLLESRATPFIEEYMKANTAAEKRAIVKRWSEMQKK